MRASLLLVLLTLAWARVASAETEKAFESCLRLQGKEYVAARDQFLAGDGGADWLKAKLTSENWNEQLTATSLMGWKQNEATYRKLLSAPRITDQKGTTRFAWAVDKTGIAKSAVPLMYELLLKEPIPDTGWDAAIALSNLAHADDSTLINVRMLHEALRKAELSQPQRDALAWLLGRLPAKYQEPEELAASLETALSSKSPPRSVVDPLLKGMARSAGDMTAKERDALASRLLENKRLTEVVGAKPLLHVVANVGGDKASEQIANYLENTPHEIEQRWALAALSEGQSTIGTQVLLKYADDKRSTIRTAALEGLAHAVYLPVVADKLEAVALDDDASVNDQRLAMRSLATIGTRNRNSKAIREQLEQTLQTISAAKPKDEVKQAFEELIKSLEE